MAKARGIQKEDLMKKLFLGSIIAACYLVVSVPVVHSGGVHIQLPGISVQLPGVVIGPPLVYEERYSRRRYTRRQSVRRDVYVQESSIVEGQLPAPPPEVVLPPPPPLPEEEVLTIEPGASVWLRTDTKCCYVFYEGKWNWQSDAWYYHRYHGHYYEKSAEWWVQYGFDETYWKQYDQPVVTIESWYQTHSVCCYVYFDSKWNWHREHWYHHHYRGHYFERSPQYWTRNTFDENYWRRYEYGRRYFKEDKRWRVEGHIHTRPFVQERGARIYIQPHEPRYQQHFDRGRHKGWEHRENQVREFRQPQGHQRQQTPRFERQEHQQYREHENRHGRHGYDGREHQGHQGHQERHGGHGGGKHGH